MSLPAFWSRPLPAWPWPRNMPCTLVPVFGPPVLSPPASEVSRVAAEQLCPRLRVEKLERPTWLLGYRWSWTITGPDGTRLDASVAPTWAEALAVGLAALEQASAASRP